MSPASAPQESQLGYKESMKDTARVLGSMYDGIEYRGSAQKSAEIPGAHAGVPVWNGLTDTWHPTQTLAMGEPFDEWDRRIDLLLPYQVNTALLAATGNPHVKFMHCLPALHNRETEVGQQIYDKRGLEALEVGGLRAGGEPDADHQGGDGGHHRAARMKLVAALGGNALLKRGEQPDCDMQESHVTAAVAALAPLLERHDVIVTHGNGPQVGVLALESAGDPALSRPYPFDVVSERR